MIKVSDFNKRLTATVKYWNCSVVDTDNISLSQSHRAKHSNRDEMNNGTFIENRSISTSHYTA